MSFDPIEFARQNIKYITSKKEPSVEDYGRVNYILRGNGLWEVRKNKAATFYVHRYSGDISGFPEESSLEEGFELNLPKIPRLMLNQVISFFRKLTEEHDFEAYIQIFWDREKNKYFLNCPAQKVSKGRVEYEPSSLTGKHTLVCEIHSHNSMPAFFSSIDDADERKRGDRFFGVIGNLNTVSPQIELSFIVGGGKRVNVEVEDLFEDESFPEEWLKKVTYLDRKENRELVKTGKSDVPSEGEEENWRYFQQNFFESNEHSWETDEEDESIESEDVYDNMEMVMIEDLDQLAEWEEDPEKLNGAIDEMLNSQQTIGI